ncbi:putative DNA circulation family protein [Pseudomonas sp. 8Z]|uniref:DNA circularization protein n=1 Tax=Pseudomonas sp. 8Z TaxID=2653166 RepID=UPI0012F1798F|nr:DNA circularization N-terminal domain-containing protein [Pseudomonas sp. 8Z]VXC68490.1 putative DNA circulation family protein [Pseudomonas sp. 8Z]
MAWRDEMRPGSFRGVPFYIEGSDQSGGRRSILDEFPLRDLPSTQDMGRKARQYVLDMYVIGADYMAARDKLIEALEGAGPGTLMHPYRGELQVITYGEYRVVESTREGGLARITQTFAEAGEEPRPDGSPVPGVEVNARADLVQQEAVEEFAQDWNVADYASFVGEEAVTMLQEATAWVYQAGGVMGGGAQLSGLYNRLTGSLAQLILAPGNLAASLLGLVRGLGSGTDPISALKAQMSLFNLGSRPKVPVPQGYSTPGRMQVANNQQAVYRLIERAAAVEASRLATGRPVTPDGQVAPGVVFESRDDAVQVRDQLVIELDRLQLAARPERYRSLAALCAAVVADMNRRSASLAPLAEYQLLDTQPALLIAHRLYGDASRASDIIARNKIKHPGFVPGGQVLEVLKNA